MLFLWNCELETQGPYGSQCVITHPRDIYNGVWAWIIHTRNSWYCHVYRRRFAVATWRSHLYKQTRKLTNALCSLGKNFDLFLYMEKLSGHGCNVLNERWGEPTSSCHNWTLLKTKTTHSQGHSNFEPVLPLEGQLNNNSKVLRNVQSK